MKKFLLVFLVIVCSSFSSHKKSIKDHLTFVKSEIDRIVGKMEGNTHLGIQVVSLKTGQTLYQKNPKHLFVPCSTTKIFTAAAALHYLGPNFRFETQLYTDGEIERGVLHGNLYLKGSGDPEFSVEHLEHMIFQLAAQQIHEVRGNLVIDTSCFDEIQQGPGWMWDEGADAWNAPMDALMIQHSCIDLCVCPALQEGKRPRVAIYPKTEYVQIANQAVTSSDKGDLEVQRLWMEKKNTIQISGNIPLDRLLKNSRLQLRTPLTIRLPFFARR